MSKPIRIAYTFARIQDTATMSDADESALKRFVVEALESEFPDADIDVRVTEAEQRLCVEHCDESDLANVQYVIDGAVARWHATASA